MSFGMMDMINFDLEPQQQWPDDSSPWQDLQVALDFDFSQLFHSNYSDVLDDRRNAPVNAPHRSIPHQQDNAAETPTSSLRNEDRDSSRWASNNNMGTVFLSPDELASQPVTNGEPFPLADSAVLEGATLAYDEALHAALMDPIGFENDHRLIPLNALPPEIKGEIISHEPPVDASAPPLAFDNRYTPLSSGMDAMPEDATEQDAAGQTQVKGYFKLVQQRAGFPPYIANKLRTVIGRPSDRKIIEEGRREKKRRKQGRFFKRSVMSEEGGILSVAGDIEAGAEGDDTEDTAFLGLVPSSNVALFGISRKHAEIFFDENADSETSSWTIKVLGRNGVGVDGEWFIPGDEVELRNGAVLFIGGVLLTFQLPNEETGATPATMAMSTDFPSDSDDLDDDFREPEGHDRSMLYASDHLDDGDGEGGDVMEVDDDGEEEEEEAPERRPVKKSVKPIPKISLKVNPKKRAPEKTPASSARKVSDSAELPPKKVVQKKPKDAKAASTKTVPKPSKKPEAKAPEPETSVEPVTEKKDTPATNEKDDPSNKKPAKPAKEKERFPWMDKAERGEKLVNGVDFVYPKLPNGYEVEPPKVGAVGRPPKGGGPFSEKQYKEILEKYKHEQKLLDEGKDPEEFPFQGVPQKPKLPKSEGGVEGDVSGQADPSRAPIKKRNKTKDETNDDLRVEPDWSQFEPSKLTDNGRTHAVNLFCLLETTEPLTLQDIYTQYRRMYPYYWKKSFREGNGWMSSIRHTIGDKNNKWLVKQEHEGEVKYSIDKSVPFDKKERKQYQPPRQGQQQPAMQQNMYNSPYGQGASGNGAYSPYPAQNNQRSYAQAARPPSHPHPAPQPTHQPAPPPRAPLPQSWNSKIAVELRAHGEMSENVLRMVLTVRDQLVRQAYSPHSERLVDDAIRSVLMGGQVSITDPIQRDMAARIKSVADSARLQDQKSAPAPAASMPHGLSNTQNGPQPANYQPQSAYGQNVTRTASPGSQTWPQPSRNLTPPNNFPSTTSYQPYMSMTATAMQRTGSIGSASGHTPPAPPPNVPSSLNAIHFPPNSSVGQSGGAIPAVSNAPQQRVTHSYGAAHPSTYQKSIPPPTHTQPGAAYTQAPTASNTTPTLPLLDVRSTTPTSQPIVFQQSTTPPIPPTAQQSGAMNISALLQPNAPLSTIPPPLQTTATGMARQRSEGTISAPHVSPITPLLGSPSPAPPPAAGDKRPAESQERADEAAKKAKVGD